MIFPFYLGVFLLDGVSHEVNRKMFLLHKFHTPSPLQFESKTNCHFLFDRYVSNLDLRVGNSQSSFERGMKLLVLPLF